MLKIIGGLFIIFGLITVIIKPLIDDIREDEEKLDKIMDLIFLVIFILSIIGIIYEMIFI